MKQAKLGGQFRYFAKKKFRYVSLQFRFKAKFGDTLSTTGAAGSLFEKSFPPELWAKNNSGPDTYRGAIFTGFHLWLDIYE